MDNLEYHIRDRLSPLVAALLLQMLPGASDAWAQPPLDRDQALLDDPYVKTALVSFQPNFEGEVQAGIMLRLAPGAQEHLVVDLPRRVPSLAEQLHSAWQAEALASCPRVVDIIAQRVAARYPGAHLDDVQCFINPMAAHGARFSDNTSANEHQRLWVRLFNRKNRVAFTVDMPDLDIDPRFILHFNLIADVHLALPRGAPNERGQALLVRSAEIWPWSVHVDPGNLGGHLGAYFGNATTQIAAAIRAMTMNLTDRMRSSVARGLAGALGELPDDVFFRSEMTDISFRDGILPILVLLGRPHVPPFEVQAGPHRGTSWIEVNWKLPAVRPIPIKSVILVEGDQTRSTVEPLASWTLDSQIEPGSMHSYAVCTVNVFDERACSTAVSARADAPAILPPLTVTETAAGNRLEWPAWTDPNATGALTMVRGPLWPTGTKSFPLFGAGGFLDAEALRHFDEAVYWICVTSHGGQQTCAYFRPTQLGAYATKTFYPLSPYGSTWVCIRVDGQGTEGTPVALADCLRTEESQQFAFFTDDSLRDRNSRKCLTPAGSTPGSAVVLGICQGLPEQRWHHDNGLIRNEASALCLQPENLSFAASTPLIVEPCTEPSMQGWYFVEPPR